MSTPAHNKLTVSEHVKEMHRGLRRILNFVNVTVEDKNPIGAAILTLAFADEVVVVTIYDPGNPTGFLALQSWRATRFGVAVR